MARPRQFFPAICSLQNSQEEHYNYLSHLSLKLLASLCTAAVGIFLPTAAHALGGSDVTIKLATDELLVVDSNYCSTTEGPQAAYVGFTVTNTSGDTLTDLEAVISGIVGSGFQLSGGQAATQYVGSLADGESRTVYWYTQYVDPAVACNGSKFNALSANLTATVSDANPGNVSDTATITTADYISANAGGKVISTVLGPGYVAGQIIPYDVQYEFGNTQVGDRFNLQPSGNLTYDASCFQLIGSEVIATDVTAIPLGTKDKLFYQATQKQTGSGHRATVRYFIRYLCSNVSTTASPYASQTSGNTNKKYTGNYEDPLVSVVIFPSGTNPFIITKNASQTSGINPGEAITYTVAITNTSSYEAVIDRVTDNLPSGLQYAGLAAGSDITETNSGGVPANGATGTLVWSGQPPNYYTIPANSSIFLIYNTTALNDLGTHENTVTASVGSETVGPATETIVIGSAADLSITKIDTVDPVNINTNVEYTLTVSNNSADTAENVEVTDTLPTGTTFVSASGTGWSCSEIGGVVTCTLASNLAGNATAEPITVTVIAPGATGDITNTASVSSTTPDPVNSNNTTDEITTIEDLTTLSEDYGDAPASYGDASHNLTTSPNLYLGNVAPDSEANSQLTSSPSTGDDDDGNDDEDAFIALPNVPFVDPSVTTITLSRKYNLNVPVTNTTGGDAILHAWIDFNQDGRFEAAEYQSTTVNNNATSVSLSWNIPLTTLLGDTHARFRLTSDTLTDNTGPLDPLNLGIDERALGNATDGEVEDYPISIAVPLYDYGDAPDGDSGTEPGDYQTTESDGGPSHVVVDTVGLNLTLGNNVDGDDGSLQNSNADADDLDGTSVDLLNTLVNSGNIGLDDEDGVDINNLPALTATPGQTYTVPVTVRNNIPLLNAFLVGYIDFNQDGDFNDAGEKSNTVTVSPFISTNPADELRTFNVTFITPAGIVSGDTYVRFRLSSIQEIAESATGASASVDNGDMNYGEIEDYKIAVAEDPNTGNSASSDYGDAPTSYGDASHDLASSPGLYLGSVAPDGEVDTQITSAAAAGDDDDGSDDEDAFYVLPNVPLVDPSVSTLSLGRNYSLTVPVTNITGSSATLHAWIDFNQNGAFEAEEYQSALVGSGQTSVNLSWDMDTILNFLNLLNLPLDTFIGDTYARFRLTSDTLTDNTGALDPLNLGVDERSFGSASDGEVEDYSVNVSVPLYDYGDAPDTGTGTGIGNYQTTESDAGPTHEVIQDPLGLLHLSLGTYVDGDDGSLQNNSANADDVDTQNVDLLGTLISNSNTGFDDEDGISSFPTLTAIPGQTYTVSVTVRNNIPLLNAFLVGYIDFNRDGDFDDPGEKSATVTVPSDLLTIAPNSITLDTTGDPRTFDVNFTIPAGVTSGNTYARFRLGSIREIVESATTVAVGTNNGEVNNGEVEDYPIAIAPVSTNPNVLLVKRITQINGDTASAGGDALSGYIDQDDAINPYDDNNITVADPVDPTDPPKDTDQWPDLSTNLIGGIDGGNVMPNDEIEYTIYYLSSGDATAENVLFCDYVPTFTSFIPNAYTGNAPQATGGIGGADLSIELFRNGSTDYHTGANDGDSATYFAPGTDPANSFPSIDCDGDSDGVNANPNGAVVVNLGNLPDATTNATEAYGYVRFRARVK